LKFLPPWTEDDFSIIKEKWLLGWTDDKIARLFEPPRTPKGVQGQRLRYKLTAANYPDRPNPKKNGSQYNDADILRRHHAGELPKSIAISYGVSTKAMTGKINRLLMVGHNEPTERQCLRCFSPFLSSLPKSVNRRCLKCQRELREAGTSYLTIGAAVIHGRSV